MLFFQIGFIPSSSPSLPHSLPFSLPSFFLSFSSLWLTARLIKGDCELLHAHSLQLLLSLPQHTCMHATHMCTHTHTHVPRMLSVSHYHSILSTSCTRALCWSQSRNLTSTHHNLPESPELTPGFPLGGHHTIYGF